MADKITIALYMRLSREDHRDAADRLVSDESNSITNQRKLLFGFLKRKQEFAGSDTVQYVDDGHSGTEFERPGFVEMMEEIKRGKIQCVIVKDFSRFGRDYIVLGDYIEHIFPFMQVRFISVNDGYDSEAYRGKTPDIDVPFRNLAYSIYSQDISDKVKSSIAVRRKKGLYVGAIPPYGYGRGEGGLLAPDAEAKETVVRIYSEYLSGTGLTELARKLNGEGVPSPKQYKINKGILCKQEGKSYFWEPTTLHQILRNEIYIGNIIEKDIFKEVQRRMGTKKHGEARTYILKGLVRCGECGRLMVRDKKIFRCRYQKFTVHREVQSIPEADLEEIIFKAAKIQVWLLEKREELALREIELCRGKQKRLHMQIKRERMRTEKKREENRLLYQQYRQGRIGKETYLAGKKQGSNLVEGMEKELARMEGEERALRGRVQQIGEDGAFVGKWPEDRRKLLQCMVESVEVYGNRQIHIIWRFLDKLTYN